MENTTHQQEEVPVTQADTHVTAEPNDTMGIVSIGLSGFGVLIMLLIPIFGFPLSVAGFIVGLVGVSKAKTAGHKQTLSKIGWIIGLAGMITGVLLIIVGTIYFLLMTDAYSEAGKIR